MHPAPSLILFSSLSGLGLGLLAWASLLRPEGGAALLAFGLGLALAAAGLGASVFHLRRPARARFAFSQWRSSWLSREAVLAPLALGTAALHGLLLALRGESPLALGLLAALLCALTVLSTAMIYATIRAVPRWHHWSVPAHFLALAAAGGALLAAPAPLAAALLIGAGVLVALHWHHGRTAFARAGQSAATATALEGRVRLFAPPHTGPNYVTREMAGQVGRARAGQLRLLALALGLLLPLALLWLSPPLAALSHLAGVLCARWLFFAEAEHVVSLYYGRP
ncbi:DmsC/YnfH family molybdoenzyme membrane anchor subunit [Rubellimicrobium sp. CFH 75288]|uniref:DmsC/YnfH family molybdoenzyme membrane anchor subunit n=1 Tax=Rubellimicrobium sp. CFH 75288 TaxID=2697034 RepID=UPI0014134E73|nr:DmsC/YnfH family molybdoenzyme membrane anchor subunit [Rubellimicrobium sp. CFH 75288]NAZ38011.1 dimethyl sulfoxide reductase anchor subunit [Rubellimicrobium sp. CFH 75288]